MRTELWDGLVAAARGVPSSAAARAALTLSADGGRPRLGWVRPPSWAQVERRIADTAVTVPQDGGLLVAATGGWAFAARAAAASSPPRGRLLVADMLDGNRIAAALTAAGRWPAAAALAVSASGQTHETRLLAKAIAATCHDRLELHSLSEHATPGGFSLRPGTAVNALLGAPLSVPFALVCAATGLQRFRLAYDWFRAVSGPVGAQTAALATAVPARGTPPLHVVLPAGVGEWVRLWALQALRQGLGGPPGHPVWCDVSVEGAAAQSPPDPAALHIRLADALPHGTAGIWAGSGDVQAGSGDVWAGLGDVWASPGDVQAGSGDLWASPGDVQAGSGDVWAGSGDVRACARPGAPPAQGCAAAAAQARAAAMLARAMTVMYATAVLTACLGIRCGIEFASHPAVAKYKSLLHSPAGGRPGSEVAAGRGEIAEVAARWLVRRPALSGAHLVRFDGGTPHVRASRLSELTGRRWEVHPGSRWNHHSYQAVAGEPGLGVVVIARRPGSARVTGDDALDRTLRALAGGQAAIARATCGSLAPRALLVTLTESGGSL